MSAGSLKKGGQMTNFRETATQSGADRKTHERRKVLVGFSGKITLRDGTVLFAWRDRGIRGFPIYAYI